MDMTGKPVREKTKPSSPLALTRNWRGHLWGYFFILPNLLLTLVFFVYPLIDTIKLSFYDAGLGESTFIGLDNYIEIFKDSTFLHSLKNTFLYVIVIVPIIVIISFTLAGLMQNLHGRSKAFYRALFYMPVICTPVVLTMVWAWIFNMNNGLLNYIVGLLGIQPVEWLGTPSMAFIAICVIVITWSIGEPLILYLSAMESVPKEYYEAAEIDGASPIQRFFHITLPAIANTSLFVILTTTIAVFQIFVVIRLLTGGGPFNSTESLIFTIYRTAFSSVEFGVASAQSVVLFVIIMVISLVQLKFFKPKT
ncbi:carbohydrate ABC transporter permease [Paenibacillus eucommiae]|uniref:ABC-type sugar transport system permease subunit n=1 Tax=Paenibacillus eucommiae TaxID=1355755 RepID=A0ABS4J2A7_9BACL|nr:sugar ABC transporter permease [Paenibacillus eucommiae]MBP1993957.1 ABC-type sugar transport system permease subunit [Paenibacillus eucommiae]